MKRILTLCLSLLLAQCSCGSPAYADALGTFTHPKYEKVSRNLHTGIKKKFHSLDEINSYVNSFPYKADVVDNWEPPSKFFAHHNGGDCEDYALAKYALAIESGFEGGYLVLAIDRYKNQAHALFVYNDMVYDNQTDKVIPMSEDTRYEMVGKLKMEK